MSSPATLICKECNYENELQRIHCHQCGAKLDRSTAFNEDQKRKSEKDRQKRVKNISSAKDKSASSPHIVRNLFRVLIRGAATAAIILIALPPAQLPPDLQANTRIPSASATLTSLTMASAGRRESISEESINEFFRTSVQLTPLSKYVTFKRVFTDLEDGTIRIILQAEVFDYALYSGVTYQLKIENNKLVATPKGTNFGRLNLPAQATILTEKLFAPIWAKLTNEREQLDKLAAIEVRKDGIILTAKGNTPPSSPQ